MASSQTSEDPHARVDSTADLLEILTPKPSPVRLMRLGGNFDGAYLVPEDLEGIVACFSPGVNNFKDFEDELVKKHNIDCHLCDFTSEPEKFRTPLIEDKQTFKKKWLSDRTDPDSITLEDWVREFVPNETLELMLQMDIEGAEFQILAGCSDAILKRFRVIVLELHELDKFNDKNFRETKIAPALKNLDQHFICVHAHPNNHSRDIIVSGTNHNLPVFHELTFLRRDRFESPTETGYIAPCFPHANDIAFNCMWEPPLQLNKEWYHSKHRPFQAWLRIIRDVVAYRQRIVLRTAKATRVACMLKRIIKRA
jgi:FkbM family methyltransferase